MSQSLGSQGRKRPQSGEERGRTHSAAIVYSKCRRMSTDWQCHCCQYCVSGSVVVCCLMFWRRENCIWIVYHQGYRSSRFFLHTCAPPPILLRSGFQVKEKTQKINPLPLKKLIYRSPLMKPDSSCNIFMIRGQVPHSRDYWHCETGKNGGTGVERCHLKPLDCKEKISTWKKRTGKEKSKETQVATLKKEKVLKQFRVQFFPGQGVTWSTTESPLCREALEMMLPRQLQH